MVGATCSTVGAATPAPRLSVAPWWVGVYLGGVRIRSNGGMMSDKRQFFLDMIKQPDIDAFRFIADSPPLFTEDELATIIQAFFDGVDEDDGGKFEEQFRQYINLIRLYRMHEFILSFILSGRVVVTAISGDDIITERID